MTTIHHATLTGTPTSDRTTRWSLAMLLLAGSCIVYLPYGLAQVTPTALRLPLWLAIALGFGLAAIVVRRHHRHHQAWPPLFALFVGSLAQLLDWHFSHWLTRFLGIRIESPAGLALDKLESSMIIIVTILVFILMAREGLGSLYLRRGNVRLWLPIGIVTFLLFAFMPFTQAQTLFGSGPLSVSDVIPHLPWILIFVLSNGFAEELLFRGLLLPRFQPLVGRIPAILVVTITFTLWHLGAGYANDMLIFLSIVFALGLTWAALTVKSNSLWGAVLFHAGADIPIIVAYLAWL